MKIYSGFHFEKTQGTIKFSRIVNTLCVYMLAQTKGFGMNGAKKKKKKN